MLSAVREGRIPRDPSGEFMKDSSGLLNNTHVLLHPSLSTIQERKRYKDVVRIEAFGLCRGLRGAAHHRGEGGL